MPTLPLFVGITVMSWAVPAAVISSRSKRGTFLTNGPFEQVLMDFVEDVGCVWSGFSTLRVLAIREATLILAEITKHDDCSYQCLDLKMLKI